MDIRNPDPLVHLHSNFDHFLREAAARTRPDELEVCDQFTRCLTGIPHPFGNIVIAGQQTEEEFKAMLEELEQWIQAHSITVALLVVPSVGLPDRGNWAAERSWVLLDDMPGMWMPLPEDFEVGPLAPGVSIRVADDAEGLAAVTDVVAKGYPVPIEAADLFMRGIDLAGKASDGRLANVLATIDGKPAACASVCVKDGVAGIYCVATLEEFRGRGLGSAITRAAMVEGARHGASYSLLHATEMGTPIYRKIGFTEQCRAPVYGFGM